MFYDKTKNVNRNNQHIKQSVKNHGSQSAMNVLDYTKHQTFVKTKLW